MNVGLSSGRVQRWSYTRVVAMFACPGHSCTLAMSAWWSSALVAAVARNPWAPISKPSNARAPGDAVQQKIAVAGALQKPDPIGNDGVGCGTGLLTLKENSLLPVSAGQRMSKRCREGMRWRRRGSLRPREARCWKRRPRRRRWSNTGSSPTNPSHAYRQRTLNTLKNLLIFRSS